MCAQNEPLTKSSVEMGSQRSPEWMRVHKVQYFGGKTIDNISTVDIILNISEQHRQNGRAIKISFNTK
jgi:hypothetical protein